MKKKLHWLRLLKQVEYGKCDYREYDIPKLRTKSYEEPLMHLMFYDYPHGKYMDNKNWKRYRKTQYKGE